MHASDHALPSFAGNSILHATPNPKDSIFFGSLRLMGYNNQPDPDAVRWGLHDLEVCTLTNAGSCRSVTRYETDGVADQGYVREGYNNNQTLTGSYVDNDAVIAQFYQDELSRVDRAEASNDPSRTSVVEQEWPPHPRQGEAIDISHERDGMEDKNVARLGNQGEGSSPGRDDDESVCSIEIEEESWSEFGKRLNHMIPIAVTTSSLCHGSRLSHCKSLKSMILVCCSMCLKSMESYRQRMNRFLIINGYLRGMFSRYLEYNLENKTSCHNLFVYACCNLL